MKAQIKRWAVVLGVAAAALLVVGLICYTQISVHPIQEEDGRAFSLSRVFVGNSDIITPVNVSAIEEALRGCTGKRQLEPMTGYILNDTTIELDGIDANGPAHFVLEPDKGVFYRSGYSIEGYFILDNAEELYDTIWAELEMD